MFHNTALWLPGKTPSPFFDPQFLNPPHSNPLFPRSRDFEQLITALKEHKDKFDVVAIRMSKLSPFEQVRISSQAAVYVSTVGGGAVTGMFVPRGASVVLFHEKDSLLDKDFWNQASWLRAKFYSLEEYTNTQLIVNFILHAVENAKIFGGD